MWSLWDCVRLHGDLLKRHLYSLCELVTFSLSGIKSILKVFVREELFVCAHPIIGEACRPLLAMHVGFG